MTTTGDAIKGALFTNWATGTGGTKPTLESTEDVRHVQMDPLDRIWILTYTYRKQARRINDSYENTIETIMLLASCGKTGAGTDQEDRLKQIVDEVRRIINANGVTGYNDVDIVDYDYIPTDKSQHYYACNMIVELKNYLVDSATTPGSQAVSSMTVDTLTVNTTSSIPTITGLQTIYAPATDYLNILERVGGSGTGLKVYFESGSGTDEVVIAAKGPTLDLKTSDGGDPAEFTVEDTGVSTLGMSINEALMLGSANAAWVPCAVMGAYSNLSWVFADGRYQNLDATDYQITYVLPKECLKGTLKLYLKSLTFGIQAANATNYIDTVTIYGINDTTRTTLDTDTTNHTSSGVKTFAGATFPAAVFDVSGYDAVNIRFDVVVANGLNLAYYSPMMQIYYAT